MAKTTPAGCRSSKPSARCRTITVRRSTPSASSPTISRTSAATSELCASWQNRPVGCRISRAMFAKPTKSRQRSREPSASNIPMVVDEIMNEAQHLECLAGNELDIEIALREALANAILHGCKSDPGKTVQCIVACDEEHGMLIIVRDPGVGFDPSALPECV